VVKRDMSWKDREPRTIHCPGCGKELHTRAIKQTTCGCGVQIYIPTALEKEGAQ
jgi:hypothetical protein